MKLNLFYTFIILSALGFLYRRFMDKYDYMSMKKDNKYLKEFLETHYGGEFNSKKPIAWIYLPFETNAMNWESFYSRNNKNINNTLLREIINKNTRELKSHFNVLIIDDNSFKYLLDDTATDLETIGDPLKTKIIDLYILKLIRKYGGLRVPNYFAVQNSQELFNLLNRTTKDTILCFKKPFNNTLIYDIKFTGTLFNNNETIKKLEHLQSLLISNDATDESNFKTTSIVEMVSNNIINYDMNNSGVYDINGNILVVEDFMSETKKIEFPSSSFIIYIPIEQISKRTHYNWVTYLNNSHSIQLSKFLY
jgi:hypothetical protein